MKYREGKTSACLRYIFISELWSNNPLLQVVNIYSLPKSGREHKDSIFFFFNKCVPCDFRMWCLLYLGVFLRDPEDPRSLLANIGSIQLHSVGTEFPVAGRDAGIISYVRHDPLSVLLKLKQNTSLRERFIYHMKVQESTHMSSFSCTNFSLWMCLQEVLSLTSNQFVQIYCTQGRRGCDKLWGLSDRQKEQKKLVKSRVLFRLL